MPAPIRHSGGMLFYCSEDDSVLLVYRAKKMSSPHTWSLPGGQPEESDKNSKETAERETKEELSIIPKYKKLGRHNISHNEHRYDVYICEITKEEKDRFIKKIRLDDENEKFQWFKPDDIPKETHFDLTWVPDELAEKKQSEQLNNIYTLYKQAYSLVQSTCKIASTFEPPPKFYKTVSEWASEAYAGHVLALVDKRLKVLSQWNLLPKHKQILSEYRQTGEAKIRALEEGKNIRFKNVLGSDKDFVISHEKKINGPFVFVESAWRSGLGKGSHIMWWGRENIDSSIETFYGWLKKQEKLCEEKNEILNRRNTNLDKQEIINLHLLRRECLKYTSTPKLRANKIETSIMVNLDDWRYLSDEERYSVKPILNNMGLDTAIIIMYFRKKDNRASGRWSKKNNVMEIYVPGIYGRVPSLHNFQEGMADLLNTCWHECLHAGQGWMQFIKVLEEDAGLPGHKQRQPGTDVRGFPRDVVEKNMPLKSKDRIEHHLQDIEFYTNMPAYINLLKKDIKNIPQDKRLEWFRFWTHMYLPVPEIILTTNYSRSMFDSMHQFGKEMLSIYKTAPEKWKKLTSELWKALSDDGLV